MSNSALSRTTPTVDDYNRLGADGFPGLVGLVVQQVSRDEVRITLLHELGHYLGLDEDQVTALGLA